MSLVPALLGSAPGSLRARPVFFGIIEHDTSIIVAGPYRSGTKDDPVRLAENVAAATDVSLRFFRAGHLAVMGEWFALPLVKHAGSGRIGDTAFDEIFHPVRDADSPGAMAACGSAARRLPRMSWWPSPQRAAR